MSSWGLRADIAPWEAIWTSMWALGLVGYGWDRCWGRRTVLNALVSFGNIFLVLAWSSPENWVASTIERSFFIILETWVVSFKKCGGRILPTLSVLFPLLSMWCRLGRASTQPCPTGPAPHVSSCPDHPSLSKHVPYSLVSARAPAHSI